LIELVSLVSLGWLSDAGAEYVLILQTAIRSRTGSVHECAGFEQGKPMLAEGGKGLILSRDQLDLIGTVGKSLPDQGVFSTVPG
jgi:hypothetical protein